MNDLQTLTKNYLAYCQQQKRKAHFIKWTLDLNIFSYEKFLNEEGVQGEGRKAFSRKFPSLPLQNLSPYSIFTGSRSSVMRRSRGRVPRSCRAAA